MELIDMFLKRLNVFQKILYQHVFHAVNDALGKVPVLLEKFPSDFVIRQKFAVKAFGRKMFYQNVFYQIEKHDVFHNGRVLKTVQLFLIGFISALFL